MAILAMDEQIVFEYFCSKYDIRGKKVLEIGGSIPEALVSSAAEWVSVDPLNENKATGNYRYIRGRAQSICYQENYFDYVFSCNAFHHISRFSDALREIYRVLKPGGIVLSIFGPIWSAPDGCHLENVPYRGGLIQFWEEQLVPDWYHLVYDFKELYMILIENIKQDKAYAIADYIYFSNWINRMSYFDYQDTLAHSDFIIIEMTGSTDLGYKHKVLAFQNPFINKYITWEQKEHSSSMMEFAIRDLNLILQKPQL